MAMHWDMPVPIDRLTWFREKLGMDGTGLEALEVYRSLFLAKKEAFAEDFYAYFYKIPETRLHIEHERRRGLLKNAWTGWFESLFTEGFSEAFLDSHWRSGVRHVEVNIDHRFITLGYALVRQFCQKIAKAEIPLADRQSVMEGIDKMVDFCLLIETQAFIEATTQCDLEVVKGISHQVRNPLTVIGGHIHRLKREAEPASPVHRIYDTILEENRRLERMVSDVAVYSDLFQREPELSEVSLEDLISRALRELNETAAAKQAEIDVVFGREPVRVQGDPEGLGRMFYYLLQNSLEAADREKPHIRISASLWKADPRFVEVEIFNNGTPPSREDLANLFVPFFSSKPYGTGFGLPIAQLAAKKSLGELHLEPVPDRGTRCLIKLRVSMAKALEA